MNKKISYLHMLLLLASSCYVCQSFAMESDRAKVSTLERRYHLALDLAEPEGALPRLCELAKINGKKTLWRTWAYEDITQAIADLQKIQAHCTDYKDAALTETVSNLLSNLKLLKYMVARQNGFETENIAAGAAADAVADERAERVRVDGAHERAIADAQTTLTRASAAQERFAAALAALTGRVDTHDKFATDIASLTSKVATHDNLAGTLASLKSEIDELNGSVSSRFAESETREKTEFARISAAHDRVAAALTALTSRVDAHDSLTSALTGLTSRVDELNKSIPARFSALESRLDTTQAEVSALNKRTLDHPPRLVALESRLDTTDSNVNILCRRATALELRCDKTEATTDARIRMLDAWTNATQARLATEFASQASLSALDARLQDSLATKEGVRINVAALDTRLKKVEILPTWAQLQPRLDTTDAKVTALNTWTDAVITRLGALEARMVEREKDAALMATAHCELRGPGPHVFYSHGDVPYCGNASGGLLVDRFMNIDSRLRAVEGRSSSSSALEARVAALEGGIAPLKEVYTRSASIGCPYAPGHAAPKLWLCWR